MASTSGRTPESKALRSSTPGSMNAISRLVVRGALDTAEFGLVARRTSPCLNVGVRPISIGAEKAGIAPEFWASQLAGAARHGLTMLYSTTFAPVIALSSQRPRQGVLRADTFVQRCNRQTG